MTAVNRSVQQTSQHLCLFYFTESHEDLDTEVLNDLQMHGTPTA
jgi:hypothetical protein